MMKKVATVKILDEINCVIIGLDRQHYETLYNTYGYFAKNYFFNPKYKLGSWDGKIRLFTKAGKTSVNFIPEILPVLKTMGYSIKIIDNRSKVNIHDIPEIDENYLSDYNVVLGPHQVDAVNATISNGGGIVLAGTGAGKTYMTAALVKLYEQHNSFKTIVIVPTVDLVNQTASEIAAFGLDVGILSGSKKQTTSTHLVSTWQSLQNCRHVLHNFHVVIVDEGHGASATVMKSMLTEEANKAVVRIGLTGTLPKEEADSRTVQYVLGSVVYTVPAHVLIDKGWLAKLNIDAFILQEDLTEQWVNYQKYYPEEAKNLTYAQFKKNFFPDFQAEREFLRKQTLRTEFIAEKIMYTRTKHGNTLVLVNGIEYGKKLSKLIPDSIFISAADSAEVRKAIYDSFDTKDDMVLIATMQLVSTGLNIKRIMAMTMIDSGKSFIKIIQSIGRGLRKASDKSEVFVTDISSDTKYSAMHRKSRLSYYKESNYKFTQSKVDYHKLFNVDDSTDPVLY